MKLPFASQQNNLSSSSPDVKQHIIVGAGGGGGRFEPKSVLDICRSPAGGGGGNKTSEFDSVVLSSSSDPDPLPLDSYEHGIVNQFEEWDSLMNELGLHEDDSAKSSSSFLSELPDLPPAKVTPPPPPPTMSLFLHSDFENPNPNPNPLDFMIDDNNGSYDFVDELIRIAECFETQSLHLAQVILARLNQRLGSPAGKPLQRAAFYFKEALQQLIATATTAGSTRLTRSSSSSEIVQAIKAYKTFSAVSPVPMFSSFTANQAILEAVDGATIVHVVDFDIGIGGHWASFMKAIVEKAENRKVSSPAFRITAVVPEEYVTESRLIRDNLFQFAVDLNLRFEIDFVSVETFEHLSFKSMKFIDGEKTAVLLTPTIFRRIGADFVNDLRQISPNVIVHVDGEGLTAGGTSFFRQTVIEGLEFYSTVLESLEAANVGVGVGGGGGDWLRKIEVFVLLPKIVAAVGAAGRRATPWREAFGRAGIRPVGQSQFADFQAECLLRRIQVRGFHVAKRHGEMVLCWHDKPLVATSAWRF